MINIIIIMLISLSLTAGPGIGPGIGIGIDQVVSVIEKYLDPAIRGETPLDAGPSLVWAEIVLRSIWLTPTVILILILKMLSF